MPLPLIALMNAGSVTKRAMRLLAEWNRLDPEQRAFVREPAMEVMRGLDELRRAVGHRLFGDGDDVSWEEAREMALKPSVAFLMAKRAVAVVVAEQRLSNDALARAMGAVGPRDAVVAEALKIAEDDAYIKRDRDHWVVTDFADRELVESEHVRYIEKAIVEYVQESGLSRRDDLAEAVGAQSFDSAEFQAALERAVTAGTVEWLANGLYGLPADRLIAFEAPTDDEPTAPAREIKAILAELAGAVNRLRRAVGDARHLETAPRLLGAQPAAMHVDPMERLAKLKQLLDAGALSQDEFAAQKARVLATL